MEDRAFDTMTRALGVPASRRLGLKAALGAVLGIGIAGGAAAKRTKRGAGRPGAEGPCGSGKRKDNICTKDADCCTGICETSTGKTNKDGKGRCRCIRRGKACSEDRNCCSGLHCGGGRCSKPIETGFACVVGVDTCADPLARCAPYADGALAIMEDGPINGTFCLLPPGAACGDPALGDPGCDSIYCAPDGNASGICGATNLADACAPGTDTGASSTIWTLKAVSGALLPCGMSMGGYPAMVTMPAPGISCTTDADCYGQASPFGTICISNSSPSSLFTYLGVAPGGSCMSAVFPCTQAGDCPNMQGFTAACEENSGFLVCTWGQ